MKALSEMTFNEKQVRKMICEIRDEYVGGIQNACYDYSEEEFTEMYGRPTRQSVIDYIYDTLMKGNEPIIRSSISMLAIERKHVKFLGEAFIRELIADRVDYDYDHNGWDFPNDYSKEEK